jgi:hypothetical protein
MKRYSNSVELSLSERDYVLLSMRKVLDIFRETRSIGTFFVVGKIVEFAPEILDWIIDEGHEIGLHSYSHINLRETTPADFDRETSISRDMVWSRAGVRPVGFRAPEFSICKHTAWALDILEKYGFVYDSSIIPGLRPSNHIGDYQQMFQKSPCTIYRPSHENPFCKATRPYERIIEIPALVRDIVLARVPAGGGFYARALGPEYVLSSIKRAAKAGVCPMFYIHNWEVAGMPRIPMPKILRKFAYLNIPCNGLLSHILSNIRSINASQAVENWKMCQA